MKKIYFLLLTLYSAVFVSAQSNDWKQIQTPNLSTIDVLYQNQRGDVIASTQPFIGVLKSLDGCKTWSFIDTVLRYISAKGITENIYGEIIFYRDKLIYTFNLSSGLFRTIESKTYGLSQIVAIGDETIIGYKDKNLYTYGKDSLIKSQYLFSAKIHKLLDASQSDKTYCIYLSNNIHFIYQIDKNGELSRVRELNQVGRRYFYHNNTLIRDNQFSSDLGQTWSQFDLPFTEPDTIFKYNNMLAFGKGNKIYYKENNINTFSIITLPSETDLANTSSGKYIITENKEFVKNNAKILRTQNGIFEPLIFNLATPYVDYFAAGFDEKIIASYFDADAFIKIDSNSSWTLLPFKTSSFSFSEDKYIDILDSQRNIYSSFDKGLTWQNLLNVSPIRLSSFFRKKNGVFAASSEKLYFRKTNERIWNVKDLLEVGGNEVVQISNQADLYKNYAGAEQLTHSDTLNQFIDIRDISNFNGRTATHYEMNTFYNISYIYENNKFNHLQLASSYDRGVSFIIKNNFVSNIDDIYGFETTPSGHLVIYRRYSLLISPDEGRTWEEIKVNLNPRDYISRISISPDHYIYISTVEKGILKYKYPLAKPNIIYLNLNEDAKEDCEPSNDVTPLPWQKISLENLSTQLTDVHGKAVFYSHSQQNNLFVHNENDILDLCQDTLAIDFVANGGQVISDTISASTQKVCAHLEVNAVSVIKGSINYGNTYYVYITNSGNTRSTSTDIHITLDPYQKMDTTYNSIVFHKISDAIYSVQIPPLEPSERFFFYVNTPLLPYVPFGRTVCIDFAFPEGTNQCRPYQNIIKCNKVDRAGKNKTIALKFFEDTNGNCLKDPSEKYTIGNFYTINNNRDLTLKYDSIQYIISSLDTNNISFKYNDKLYKFCQENYAISIHKDSLFFEIEIPFRTLAYCTDIQLSAGHGSLRPCFNRSINYRLSNDGNITSGPISVSIELAPEIEVVTVIPTPISINGNTYEFLVNGLTVEATQSFQFGVTVPCTDPIGKEYCLKAIVTESTNSAICQLNKEFKVDNCIISRGAYDPNDKTIFVSGVENKLNIQKDDEIEYRIRFQNTGTDTAYTVRIEDKLSSKFDIASIKLTDFSHACTWKIENCILIVTFSNINLVDSFTNSLGSNGFVTFKIKLKESIRINDEIRNRASIFFDFNDPIITNEVIRNFGTIVSTYEPSIKTKKLIGINFVPNPTSTSFKIIITEYAEADEISIYSVSGQLMKLIPNHKVSDDVDIRDLPSGAYIIKVRKDLYTTFGKLIKL